MKGIPTTKTLAFMLVLTAGMGLTLQAKAFRKMGPTHFLTEVAQKIGVKDEVLKKIKNLAYETRKKMISLRAKLDLARLELHRILDNRQSTESMVTSQVDKMGALKTTLKKTRILMLFRIKKLLTPEQEKKLKALRAKRGFHRGKGRRWGRHHKDGHPWRRHGRGRHWKGGKGGGWNGPPPFPDGPRPPHAPPHPEN